MFNLLAKTLSAFDFASIFGNVITEYYYYVGAIVFIALLFLFVKLTYKKQVQSRISKTTKIAMVAMLTALSVVSNTFTIGGDFAKISLNATVCFISGFTLGPIGGLWVGFGGDLIAGIIAPQGVYSPILALGSALFGYIPGLIFWNFKGNVYFKTIVCFILTYIICTVLINTTGIYLLYLMGSTQKTLIAYVIGRLPVTGLAQLVNSAISFVLLPTLLEIRARFIIKQPQETPLDTTAETAVTTAQETPETANAETQPETTTQN